MSANEYNEIIVVGYPRSGNTWLSRLLGEYLNCPITGFGSAHPLAEEGLWKKSEYIVRQLHLKLCDGECSHKDGIVSAWEYCRDHRRENEHIVHVYRDPRDVAVSAMYYWNISDIDTTVSAMINGTHPLNGVGPWTRYVNGWLASDYPQVSYERLVSHGTGNVTMPSEVVRLLVDAGAPVDEGRWIESYEKRRIESQRRMVVENGGDLNYGEAIQLKHLRHGTSGDWRSHFTRSAAKMADKAWSSFLNHYYGVDSSWVEFCHV